MTDRLAIGVVGCGGFGGRHQKAYQELWEHDIRNFEIAATCDVLQERAEKRADEVAAFQGKRPRTYCHVEGMLGREKGLGAVDITVPHREHHTLAIPCLEAGRHVTVEKPLAITMRAGRLMLDAAKKAGVILQVAENYRRSPNQRAVNWALREERIGRPRMIYWVDVGERLWYWAWRDHKDQAGGGWLLDGGVHFADLFRYHIGEVQSVYAGVRSFHPMRYGKPETLEDPIPVDVEDSAVALLDFENGVLGQWTSTTAAPGYAFRERVIYGEHGSLHWEHGLQTRTEKLSLDELCHEHLSALDPGEKERLFPGGITNLVATELKEFIDAALHGGDVETDGMVGYRDQAVCMALYESAYAGKPVDTAQVERCELEGYQSEINRSLGL